MSLKDDSSHCWGKGEKSKKDISIGSNLLLFYGKTSLRKKSMGWVAIGWDAFTGNRIGLRFKTRAE